MKALRRQAADFMLAHRDDFEAFVSEADLQQNEDSQSEGMPFTVLLGRVLPLA